MFKILESQKNNIDTMEKKDKTTKNNMKQNKYKQTMEK